MDAKSGANTKMAKLSVGDKDWSFPIYGGSIGPDVIDGFEIPRKAIVVLSQHVTHRHPEFWEEPDRFNPERFVGDKPRHKFAYFPFGG